MILIIQNKESNNIYNNNADEFVIIEDICKIKTLNQPPYTIVLLDTEVKEDGILEEFDYFFEEIIISIDCIAIITNKASEKLREICKFHKIALLEINK